MGSSSVPGFPLDTAGAVEAPIPTPAELSDLREVDQGFVSLVLNTKSSDDGIIGNFGSSSGLTTMGLWVYTELLNESG